MKISCKSHLSNVMQDFFLPLSLFHERLKKSMEHVTLNFMIFLCPKDKFNFKRLFVCPFLRIAAPAKPNSFTNVADVKTSFCIISKTTFCDELLLQRTAANPN